MALAALSPGGFRGNRVQIPSGGMASVKQRILRAFRSVNPKRPVPPILRSGATKEKLEKAEQFLIKKAGTTVVCSVCHLNTVSKDVDPNCVFCGMPQDLLAEVSASVEEEQPPDLSLPRWETHEDRFTFLKSDSPPNRKKKKAKMSDEEEEEEEEESESGCMEKASLVTKDGVTLNLKHMGKAWEIWSVDIPKSVASDLEAATEWLTKSIQEANSATNYWNPLEEFECGSEPQSFRVQAIFSDISNSQCSMNPNELIEKSEPSCFLRFGTGKHYHLPFQCDAKFLTSGISACIQKDLAPSFWMTSERSFVRKTKGNYAPLSFFSRFETFFDGEWQLRFATPNYASFTIKSEATSAFLDLMKDSEFGWFAIVSNVQSDQGNLKSWADEKFENVIANVGGKLTKVDVLVEGNRIPDYDIVEKSEDDRRFTLGVAYHAETPDKHRDFISKSELEKTVWEYNSNSRQIGLFHSNASGGNGTVVESYIYRGPEWTVKDVTGGSQSIKHGDWLLGVVWDENSWKLIRNGIVKGYSLQGFGERILRESRDAA